MRLNIKDIEIKIKVTDIGALKAIVSLDFGDFIVKGFRVQKSKYDENGKPLLWITPPSYKASNGTYHPLFYIPSKEKWTELQNKILSEYHSRADEHYRKVYELPNKEAEPEEAAENDF